MHLHILARGGSFVFAYLLAFSFFRGCFGFFHSLGVAGQVVFNGLVHFFHLGACWCVAFLAFATLGFASVESDVSNINDLLEGMTSDVDYIKDDVGNIYQTLQAIEGHLSEINGSDITGILTTSQSILSAIQAINTYIREETISVHDAYVYEQLENMKRESHNDFRETRLVISNYLEMVVEKLDGISSNSLSFASSYFPTNWPATTVPSYDSGFSDARLRTFFYALYSRYPTSEEFEWFKAVNRDFSFYNNFLVDTASHLDLDVLFESFEDQYDILDTCFNRIGKHFDVEPQYTLGKAYYYQYGTREATDLLSSLSNLVSSVSTTINDDTRLNNYITAITNAIVTVIGDINNEYNIEQHTTESGNETTLSDNTKTVLGDVMEDVSATFGVDGDISEINTNDIEKLSDSTYLHQLQRINSRSVLEEVTGDLRGQIDDMGNEMTSYLIPSDSANEYVLSFGAFSLFGVQRGDISFTLTRPPSIYFTTLHFCTAILKMIVVYICLTSIFHRVAGG